MSKYILAHDLGTSGNKATLFDVDGTLVSSTLYEYPTYYPQPKWVEQNPEEWWRAVCDSTKSLLAKVNVKKEEIQVVSFSAQMMGCLLVDQNGIPLRNMIIWADSRAEKQEKEMIERLGLERVYEITGHRISASYSAAKLLWIRENEPEVYKKAFKMLQAKDFITQRLTGRFISDYSDASGTNLFDIKEKRWSKEIIDKLEIPFELLPEVYPSTQIAGGVLNSIADEVGLAPGTPVVIGGGDGSCACVGAGVVKEGEAYNVLGSSSWTSLVSASPIYDEKMRTFNWVHLDPKLYSPCGTMQAAGYSYNWFKNTFCDKEMEDALRDKSNPYELINRKIKNAKPGAGGVVYLPYLLGERSPRWNLNARGSFVGMSVTTTKGDMARAVLEGVGYNLKIILNILEAGKPIEQIAVIGGGAKGKEWLQILADIWQRELVLPMHPEEATSMGAAVCAGVGIGIFTDFSEVKRFNYVQEKVLPNKNNKDIYEQLYKIFNLTYERMAEVYDALASIKMV